MDDQEFTMTIAKIHDGQDPHGDLMMAVMTEMADFARWIAKPYLQYKVIEEAELPSLTFLALSKCIHDRQDGNRGFFLSAFRWRFMAELSATANADRAIQIPKGLLQKVYAYERYIKAFMAEHGRMPERKQSMKELGMSEAELARVELVESQTVISGDAPVSADNDGTVTIFDGIPDDRDYYGEILDAREQAELERVLYAEMDALLPEQRQVLSVHYLSGTVMSMRETAEVMDSTIKDCRRLESQAFRQLSRSRKLRSFATEWNYFGQTGLTLFERTATSAPEFFLLATERRL